MNSTTTTALNSSGLVEKLDVQIALSQKILTILTGQESSPENGEPDKFPTGFDTSSPAIVALPGEHPRISLESLGRKANRALLEALNIAEVQVELRKKIEHLASQKHTIEMGAEQESSLGDLSRELINKANLLGRELFKRRVFNTCFKSATTMQLLKDNIDSVQSVGSSRVLYTTK